MLIQRSLTSAEAALLHTELKTTPNILGYTIPELLRFAHVLLAEEQGQLVGVCLSKDLWFGWTDIAVLYVLPEFRGRGVARELYTAAWKNAEERGRHIYTLSCSPAVIHLMKHFGMETSCSMLRAPLAVHLHMNKHMMSWYRTTEAIRKARTMKRSARLVGGTKRRAKRTT